MTNSKLRNSDSAYSICFSQVLLKLFTFLINTVDKGIYNILIVFYSPITLLLTGQTNKQTNKHTHKHKSSFNNKKIYMYQTHALLDHCFVLVYMALRPQAVT